MREAQRFFHFSASASSKGLLAASSWRGTLVFITHQFERKDRAGSLRLFGTGIFFIGRFAAPILCGWFADVLSWRFLFLANVPVMLIAAWLFHSYAAPHWINDTEEHPADILGIVLLLMGVGALQGST